MMKRGLFHLFLMTCAAVFLYPFIWMMVTSVKSGDENLSKDILPSMPAFRAQSPYVREVKVATIPEGCSAETWARIKPRLVEITRELITQKVARPQTQWSDRATEGALDAAAEYATMKAVNRISGKTWSEADDVVVAAFEKSLANGTGGLDESLERAVSNGQSRMILNGLQVRSKAGELLHTVRFEDKTVSGFEVEGAGKVAQDADGKFIVCSDFSETDEALELRYKFDVDVSPKDLHRISLAMVYDDTWHQIDAELMLNGESYMGGRTKWAGDNKPESLTLQFPDEEVDVDWGKRPWVKLEGPKLLDADSSQMELIIRLSPSGTGVARYGKIKRNYERIFLSMPFWSYVLNSVVLTVLIVLGAVFSSCFVAYAFARLEWPGRSIAFVILLSTMMLPPQVTMIPQFLEWRMLGWYNTLNPIWVPAWFGIAFFIFLMVQQMKGIPKDLEEAAEVDGMNKLQIWWYVVVPLVRPGMAAIAIMSFMAAWNEFMAPLIYLRDMGKFPLSVGIYAMSADETMNNDMAFIMAGNVLMTIPVIIIFFAFQRYFIQGVASSGVKG